MARIPISALPDGTIITTNYQPAAGATAQVFLHGTSTPVTIFVDETGTSTLTQPITASAYGILPGWVDAQHDIDIVATYLGVTVAPAEQTVLRSSDLIGTDGLIGGPGSIGLTSGGGGGGASLPTVFEAGSFGSTYTLPLALGETWLVGTFTTDLTVTLTQLSQRDSFVLLLTQDAIGGRILTLDDGLGSSATVPIPTGANSVARVLGEYDGIDVYVGFDGSVGTGSGTTTGGGGEIVQMGWLVKITDYTMAPLDSGVVATASVTVTLPPSPQPGFRFGVKVGADGIIVTVATGTTGQIDAGMGGPGTSETLTILGQSQDYQLAPNGYDWLRV